MLAAADPNNPFGLTFSETFAALLQAWLREYERAEALAALALARSEEHQLPDVVAWSRAVLGIARTQRGRASEGAALIRQAIGAALESGRRLAMAYFLGALADAQACAGAVSDALVTVEQALEANPSELVYRPENLRLRGALRLTQGQTELAEADFREAITLARRMGAKARELRATMSLARLLAQLGHRETSSGASAKEDDARTMLAEIYNWFTEGFDTVDLKEAKALLEELR
jgi:tetratricopeptide (TPR) repeat protein